MDSKLTIRWTDKQLTACHAADTHRYTLFGGSRGPGKSWWLRWYLLDFLLNCREIGLHGVQVALFCESYPALVDRQVGKIQAEFPRRLGEVRTSQAHGLGFHFNDDDGFIALRNLDDPSRYQSAEFAVMAVDELTKVPLTTFNVLRGSLRWPGISNTRFVAASNPGGIGHQWVKSLWIDRSFPPELAGESDQFAFVAALPDDNPHLDPVYWKTLETLPEPLRLAWRYGRWDVFTDQVFAFDPTIHVIEPMPVPSSAPLYMTFDWGYGKPYSLGWWWEDQDGRLYRFAEDYGAAPGQIDVGLRLPDEEIAARVLAVEAAQGITGRRILRLCDPTCYNRKPDYIGGGQGPSTAEVFARAGLVLTPGDPNRIQKIRQFHSRLAVPKDGTRPMLLVYRGCEAFVRTIPLMQADKNNPEDVDTRLEDHVYDEAALVAMARPLGSVPATVSAGGNVNPSKWRAK